MRMRRVRRDLGMWRARGIDISCWSEDEDGDLEIGLRTPTAQAVGPLRRAYGRNTQRLLRGHRARRGAFTR